MSGYQPEKKCVNCLAFNICNKKHKNKVCKKYKATRPMPPIAPPKLEKQRTVLSVRDFAILMNIANMYIDKLEHQARSPFDYGLTEEERKRRVDESLEELQHSTFYQDLLRIREKLGELNIEIETPNVEVE